MIALVLAALIAFQDEAIEANIRALANEDIAVREKATADLLKTPLAKLDLLSNHLTDSDAETCVRVRKVMTQVLTSNLGSRKARFQLRPFAAPEVMKEWIAQGADLKKPPKGYEAVAANPNKLNFQDDYKIYRREWVLVQSACITQDDIESARPEQDLRTSNGHWSVRFALTESGSKKFDTAAEQLFNRDPKGLMGILVDGSVLSAPAMQANRFGGSGVISGEFSEKEARDLATVLKGDWLESSIRANREKESAATPEKILGFLHGMRGLEKAVIQADPTGLIITGYVDIKEVDLPSLWQSLRERGYRLAPKN